MIPTTTHVASAVGAKIPIKNSKMIPMKSNSMTPTRKNMHSILVTRNLRMRRVTHCGLCLQAYLLSAALGLVILWDAHNSYSSLNNTIPSIHAFEAATA
jgi:hypothetical protein